MGSDHYHLRPQEGVEMRVQVEIHHNGSLEEGTSDSEGEGDLFADLSRASSFSAKSEQGPDQ